MKLDPQVNALLTAISVAGAPRVEKMSADLAREVIESGYAQMKTPKKEVFSIENISIQAPGREVPVRIYKPSEKQSLPILVFFHGGGWVLFGLDAYDSICTYLCAETGCIVISVDYRRSPEYKFPAALDDCMEAVSWAVKSGSEIGGDPSRIIVSGDSAGGNLAAAVTLRLRDEKGTMPCGQLLIYPATDYVDPQTPSMKKFAEGYSLTYDSLKWFWSHYLNDLKEIDNPYACPMKATDLSGLPDAMVIISGFDPLCDEGLQYAERLKESGCQVALSSYEDMIHGFLSYLGYFDRAKTAITEISTWLRKQYGIT